MYDAVDDRVESELRRHREAATDVALATPEVGGVDGDDERLVTGGGRPVDHVAYEGAVLPDVHLEPPAAVSVGGGDLLDRTRRHRRQRVRHPGALRCTGDRQLALRVGDPRVARRRKNERKRHRRPEQRRCRVDRRDVAENSRAELVAAERFTIRPHRHFVLGTAVDVVEHPGRQASLGDPPQVIDVRRPGEPSLRRIEFEAAEAEDGAQGVEHGWAVRAPVRCSPSRARRSRATPSNAIVRRTSAASRSSTVSTPSSPPAASPYRYALPAMHAVAPRASALTMSLPRRTPPSQMISTRPPTWSATGATRSRAAGASSSWRPPWFDRAMASTPDFGGHPSVVDGLDSLEHDRPAPVRPEPLDVVPRQASVELAGERCSEIDGRRPFRLSGGCRRRRDVGEADRLGAYETPGP